jgi:hypothetical protein
MPEISDELWRLLNGLCEGRLTASETARLEALVLASPEARQHYVTYLHLHATLYWDAVEGMAASPETVNLAGTLSRPKVAIAAAKSGRRRRWWGSLAGLVALVVLAVVFTWPNAAPDAAPQIAQQNPEPADDPAAPSNETHLPAPRQPIHLDSQGPIARRSANPSDDPATVANSENRQARRELPLDPNLPASVQHPVALINAEIRAGWNAGGVEPSPRADDAAWLRRLYLDLAGHIPSADRVQRFLADRRPDKRLRVVDELLDDPAYVRYLTTEWTNLLVGRAPNPNVNRPALEKFLRTSFAANRGWHEIVADLVSAEGRSDENGAANFLIAHLNNQAVPATAITSRLFLGEQVQCTQCHNHPSGLAKQTDFWELNSFFHQTEAVVRTERDSKTGQVRSRVMELVSLPAGGPTFYDTTNGVMKAVYPKYHATEVSPDAEVNRRQELARLMVEEDGEQLAAAFINRTWQQFFGAGFTRQIDDMGPHNPPTHPELLRELALAFRDSGYDIKQLTRWLCLSEPYQLSSQFNETNLADDPERGELPLFSRLYPQPMTVEQLYDSFLVATKAHQQGVSDWTAAEAQRQKWLQQFIVPFQTEENDEANTFEGTVTQALSLMNGPLIEKALEPSAGTYLGQVLRAPGSETDKIERLCLAALSRKPTSRELAAMHKLVHGSARTANPPATGVEGYQDLFWALLNSNEFAVTY